MHLLGLGPLQRTRHRRVGLDVLALGPRLPELAEEAPRVLVVQVSEERLDGLGGLLSAVEGDSPVKRVRSELDRF